MSETLFEATNTQESLSNADAFVKLAGTQDGKDDLFFMDNVRLLFVAVSELLRLYGTDASVTNEYIATDCSNKEYKQAFQHLTNHLSEHATRNSVRQMFARAEAKNDPEFATGLKAWNTAFTHPDRTLATTLVILHMGLAAA